jgi:hypothetical protein
MPAYLQHLKMHENNLSCYLKCNLCGASCVSWLAFRQHNLRNHKQNPLELFDTYNIMLNNLDFEDDLVIDDSVEEINELNENVEVEEEVIEEELIDVENKKINYAQYLLEMTYQNKLTAKTVDSLNYHTKHLFVSFINDLKVCNN